MYLEFPARNPSIRTSSTSSSSWGSRRCGAFDLPRRQQDVPDTQRLAAGLPASMPCRQTATRHRRNSFDRVRLLVEDGREHAYAGEKSVPTPTTTSSLLALSAPAARAGRGVRSGGVESRRRHRRGMAEGGVRAELRRAVCVGRPCEGRRLRRRSDRRSTLACARVLRPGRRLQLERRVDRENHDNFIRLPIALADGTPMARGRPTGLFAFINWKARTNGTHRTIAASWLRETTTENFVGGCRCPTPPSAA